MDQTQPDDSVVVVVTRTGGIAALRRTWRAEPGPSEAPAFVTLIDQCPWDAPAHEVDGADRFAWQITARCGERAHEARVPEAGLTGPWRTLVDAVRDWRTSGEE